jgi:hypothetical protein
MVLVSLSLTASSCAGSAERPDFTVNGMAVRVESDAPFARSDAFPGRLEVVVSAALRYWGGDWTSLEGRSLTLSSGPYVPCAGATATLGCFDGDLRVSTWDPGVGTVRCVEQTVLVHELGHAVLGDRAHHDPRWMDLQPLAAQLAGGVGYDPEGSETSCAVSVSVWRHPLDSP